MAFNFATVTSFYLLVLLLHVIMQSHNPVCLHFNRSIEVFHPDQKLGLRLSPMLEILSIATNSYIAKIDDLLVGSEPHNRVQVGDRITGVNGELLDEKTELNIEYFTQTIKDLVVPYSIEIAFAPRKVPSLDKDTKSYPALSSAITNLHVRLVDHVDAFLSTDHHFNITGVASVEVQAKQDIFSCQFRPIVVANPLSACTTITTQPGSSGRIEESYVLATRGVCTFEAKIENVIRGGGAGVIIVNTDDNTFAIPASPDRGQKQWHEHITLPSIMVSKSDGSNLIERLVGSLQSTSTATANGFSVRGHELGVSAIAQMSPPSFCDKSAETSSSVPTIEERMNSQLYFTRGSGKSKDLSRNKTRSASIDERRGSIAKEQKKLTTNSKNREENPPHASRLDSTISLMTRTDGEHENKIGNEDQLVDMNKQFESEYNRLKAMPKAVFKDSRKRDTIFRHIKASFEFSDEQLSMFKALLYGDKLSKEHQEL